MYLGAFPNSQTPVARTSQRVALATMDLYHPPSRTLGGIPGLDIIGGIVGGIFQADAAKDAAKQQRKAAEAAARAAVDQATIQADAYTAATKTQMRAAEYAANLTFQAASKKSDNDLAAVREQYRSALAALEQQRLAAIDQQIANIVNNTTASMMSLSGQGLAQAGDTTRTYSRWGVAGLVLIGLGTMALIRGPKLRRKGSGKSKRTRALKIGGSSYDSSHESEFAGAV